MNNILSTDSISPAALYLRRQTGNRRFFPVVACPSDEVVFLYSKIPSYKVSDGGMENYRIVIALDTDKIGQTIKKIGSKHKIDVYVCESTIFFTPENASFLYEGKNAYQTCSIQAEQSLENKTFHLYSHKQIAHDIEFKWDKSYCDKYSPESLSSVSYEDDRIDRIKGAIVCYYAGLNQVMSPELATLKKDARKIKNAFSAIVNSPNKGLSPEQDIILKPIVKEFYEVFLSVDPVSLRNKETIDMHLSSSKTLRASESVVSRSAFLSILEELGLMQGLMQRLGLREPFDVYSLYDIIGNSKMAEILPVKFGEMDKAIAAVEMNLSSSSRSQIILDEVFRIMDKHELVISDKESKLDFYNKFLNALIDGKHLEYTDQKPSLAVALLGGQILKSFYDEEKWGSSSSRAYVNALLSNIQNGTPFDVLSDQHDILQAFAIFSQKGSDIEKISDNLSQNGILEYRYAWGLYGATYGYSQLPKTFTASVLKKDFLNDIYRLLFPECAPICENVANDLEEDKGEDGELSAVGVEIQQEKPNSEGKKIDTLNAEPIKVTPQTISDPSEELKGRLEAIRYGKKSKTLSDIQVQQIIELYAKNGQQLDEALITKIGKIRGIGDESLKAIRDALDIHPINTPDASLFPDDSYPIEAEFSFVTDRELVDIVKALRIGDSSIEKIILDDIKYVQDIHKRDIPRDNNECIKHLNNLLFSEKSKKHLKRTPNNEQIVEALIDRLKIRYR